MKKKTVTGIVFVILGISIYFSGIKNSEAYSYGPPAGYTGSPADGRTCTTSGCHDSYVLQSPKPWITSNVPLSGYWPDSVYTITAKAIKGGGFNNFGFEISPQSVTGTGLGTLINLNGTTQIVSGKYIEQTINGYATTTADSLVWVFQWKAPPVGTDSVIFYGAFNCGAGKKKSTAWIYPATLIVHQNKLAGVDNIENSATAFTAFPNPATTFVTISYKLKMSTDVEVIMYNTEGRKITSILNKNVMEGQNLQAIGIPPGTRAGIYFIQLLVNGQSSVQRIVVQ